MQDTFDTTQRCAQLFDREDKLQSFRSRFYFPLRAGADIPSAISPRQMAIYFCGNSLGLQPRGTEDVIRQELKDWQDLAVGGYMHAKDPWLTCQEPLRAPLARIVGALEDEVTVMNALTVNLHILLHSFYHPGPDRYKIIMEAGAFPSDQYAIETQVKWHGYDPTDAIIEVRPREGEKLIREEDILTAIDQHRDSLALVLFGGINYYTGQLFDIAAITAAAHAAGAFAGFDLAHVIGNVPIRLHDWDTDFAVWCSYKYLNGGPGAVGGAYVHERYARNRDHIRLGGWWGNDEAIRFKMEKGFVPKSTASGWNLSTNQVFNMTALKASLPIFDEAGIDRLRAKSIKLTAYLAFLLQQLTNLRFDIITPMDPTQRGAQLSLFFKEHGKAIHQKMIESGITVDYREPGVIRVAPAPLYNSFQDVYAFYHILAHFE
ncbi:MAG: kynureninase [Sphingobacteriales bacterium 50-39]|nr:kynureninase [Sphingobacteriales bacterium]OJW60697.1 MAG: kynureninase [Sphingobacteriales bacterium 50-39]